MLLPADDDERDPTGKENPTPDQSNPACRVQHNAVMMVDVAAHGVLADNGVLVVGQRLGDAAHDQTNHPNADGHGTEGHQGRVAFPIPLVLFGGLRLGSGVCRVALGCWGTGSLTGREAPTRGARGTGLRQGSADAGDAGLSESTLGVELAQHLRAGRAGGKYASAQQQGQEDA